MTWERKVARRLNMYLVIGHSTNSTSKSCGRLDLRCERSGERGDGVINSKKIGCPFRLRCSEKMSNVWKIYVADGKHNHRCAWHKIPCNSS